MGFDVGGNIGVKRVIFRITSLMWHPLYFERLICIPGYHEMLSIVSAVPFTMFDKMFTKVMYPV